MTMQLKEYQQRTLARVDEFLRLCKLRGIPAAYRTVARQVGEDGMAENPHALSEYETLISGLEDCPHVCVRIPTGGGKTLLAAHSIPLAGRFMQREFPAVLWMVPSDTIRTQTVEILKNPLHPCRAFLDGEFSNQVAVYDITDFDTINATALSGKACVIVSTMQALRINETARQVGDVEKARRRVYAHHEALDSHFAELDDSHLADEDLERDKGEVKHSFANLMRIVRPAVIVDEAQNAVSELSQIMMRRFRPSCILEFTATPRMELESGALLDKKKHNILVSVPARKLRKEEMIKLPVQLTEHKTWEDAVGAAIAEQRRLEELSRESGDTIRPIVLYQAESNIQGGANRVTWEKLRTYLLEELGEGGERQVKVETGDNRELGGIDLLSATCEVRHVITVQALREGWDCPFAYVLCSVADSFSNVAIEQIMGRVLRMPFARERRMQELNLAYAHVRANNFAEAANALCKGMAERLGYDEAELRESIQRGLPGLRNADAKEDNGTFGVTIVTSQRPDFGSLDLDDEGREVVRESVEVKLREDGKYSVAVREKIPEKARAEIVRAVEPKEREMEKGRLERFTRQMERSPAPSRRGVKFALLPQLQFKSAEDGEMRVVNAEEFHYEAEWDKLGAECVLGEGEFRIEEKGQTFTIYLSDEDKMQLQNDGQYRLPLTRADDADESRLPRWLEGEIRDPQGRYVPATLREFVRMNLEGLAERGLSRAQLSRARYQLAEALRRKLAEHGRRKLAESARRIFSSDADSLRVVFDFAFPPRGYQYNWVYCGRTEFRKHYYPMVGDLKSEGEEYLCAVALDSLEGVRHWIRNVQQKGHSFRIPLESGADFYPDFVVELEDGKVLVVEYKGAFLKEGAKEKREAGEMIEERGEGKVFFLMPSKEKNSPPVRDQIRAKIEEIMKVA